jgi:hypothetical protein
MNSIRKKKHSRNILLNNREKDTGESKKIKNKKEHIQSKKKDKYQ